MIEDDELLKGASKLFRHHVNYIKIQFSIVAAPVSSMPTYGIDLVHGRIRFEARNYCRLSGDVKKYDFEMTRILEKISREFNLGDEMSFVEVGEMIVKSGGCKLSIIEKTYS